MEPDAEAYATSVRARRRRRVYAATAVGAVLVGAGIGAWWRVTRPCHAMAARLCVVAGESCEEVEEALARLESTQCSKALRALDVADRLPAHLRPAMLAQIVGDLTAPPSPASGKEGPDASSRR